MPDRARKSIPEIGSVELVVAMRKFPGAAELHASELSVLASVARPRRLRRGEKLSNEGGVLHAIVLVLEGEMSVRARGELIERAGPGRAIGLLPALGHDPQGLECEAEQSTLVLSVSLEDLEDVFEEIPSFLVHLMSHVGRSALALKLLREGSPARLRTEAASSLARPLDLIERILRLRACSAFAEVTIDAVAALADVAHEVRIAAGETLWRRGEPASSLFVLVDGELDVVLDAQTRTTLRPGDLAGDVEVLAGASRPTEATARTALVALAIDREALLDAWEDHVDLAVELLRDASALVLRAGPASVAALG